VGIRYSKRHFQFSNEVLLETFPDEEFCAMNIGVIGAGNVGGTLGKRWAKNGHRLVFASGHPNSEKMQRLIAEAAPNARCGSDADAAKSSEVVLVSTPWDAAQEALQSAGDLSGKILIDATNPLLPGLEGLSFGCNISAGEKLAEWARGAKVVKAFNTVGSNIMADPQFEAGRVAMFYCGDDPQAKDVVAGLITELGFEAFDAGPLKQARVLEPFAMLWITLAMKFGYGRDIAFGFLRR
jgi:8-hydroxy-5-deazaflavin:NADPH oxidoreductase